MAGFEQDRAEFIAQWGALGSAWGINRTMAQIHALLMVAPEPLSTDDVMAELKISRGNANTNLRELVHWGLLRVTRQPGDRKEYFEAEKDIWKMFCAIIRERKKREIEPALAALERCQAGAAEAATDAEQAFYAQTAALSGFIRNGSKIMDGVAASPYASVVPTVMKLFSAPR